MSIVKIGKYLPFLSMQIPSSLCANHRSFRTVAGKCERGLIGCGFMLKAGGWDPRNNARTAYSAVVVLRGSGWYRDAAGTQWELKPGTLFQRFSGLDHTVWIEPTSAWAECWIHLGAATENMLLELGIINREQPVSQPGLNLALVRELWRAVDALELAPDRALPHHLVRLQGMLISLLGVKSTQTAASSSSFDADRACRLLADDPCIDLELVAKELGLPYARFRKSFRAAVGLGPGEYRLRRRLDRARAELLENNRPIAAIAADLGYANPFTFTTLFRKHVGISPRGGAR